MKLCNSIISNTPFCEYDKYRIMLLNKNYIVELNTQWIKGVMHRMTFSNIYVTHITK